jgi:transcriptional regulator of arginine metabolism
MMKEKSERYSAIKRIVVGGEIVGQEELLDRLIEEGFEVTQATLSRDLKALGIGKALGKNGQYVYSLPDPEYLSTFRERLKADILRGFLSLDFSGALGVIKTHPGHAGPVAFALDNFGIDEILGTVAGDDTIIVVPGDGIARERVRKSLVERIPELKEKI